MTGPIVIHEQDVRGGSAVFIPGGAVHRMWNTGTETLRVLYTFLEAS
jgi:oxalate decarboxylase/phosphoglucose isomerase-like protein (cupin superfamily)